MNILDNSFEHGPKPIMPNVELQKALEQIEKAKYLQPIFKATLLLFLCGLKPRVVFSWRFSSEDCKNLEYWLSDFKSILDVISPYVNFYIHDPVQEAKKTLVTIEISLKNQDEKIFDLSTDDRDDVKIGTALGYPKTAVQAYAANETFNVREAEEIGLTDEQKKFAYFAFSKSHYKEEVKYLQKMINTVKKVSPEIYQQVMSS